MTLNRKKLTKALGFSSGKQLFTYSSAALLLSLSGQTFAQEQATVDAGSDESVEEVVVLGSRGTLIRSIAVKQNSDVIVDALGASEFGELPGLSVADIIENLPGASGHRDKGSQNEISIRGLGPLLGYSTMNGRPITNAGFNRSVNFKKIPSELVDTVKIYKSQQADLISGGTSGLIEISTLRPVDYGKNRTSVSVEGNYNQYAARQEGDNGWGSKLTLSTVQSFDFDSIGEVGFTLGYQNQDTGNPEDNMYTGSRSTACPQYMANGDAIDYGTNRCMDSFDGDSGLEADPVDESGHVWNGYGEALGDNNTFDIAERATGVWDNDSVWISPREYLDYRNIDDSERRQNIVTAVQWVPNEKWDINAEMEYSDQVFRENRYVFAVNDLTRGLDNLVVADDGGLIYRDGISQMVIEGRDRTQVDTYNGGGIDIKYSPNDSLDLWFNAGTSRSLRDRTTIRARVYSNDYYDYTWDNSGFSDLTTGFDPNDPDVFFDADYSEGSTDYNRFRYERRRDNWRVNRNDSVRFDAEWQLDGDFLRSVKSGIRLSEETVFSDAAQNEPGQYSFPDAIDSTAAQRNDIRPGYDNTGAYPDIYANEQELLLAVRDNCLLGFSDDKFMSNVDDISLNQGADYANSFLSLDANCALGLLDGDKDPEFNDWGGNKVVKNTGDLDVKEGVTEAYVMAKFENDIARGNFGVRYVETRNSSYIYGSGAKVKYNPDTDTYASAGAVDGLGLDEVVTGSVETLSTELLPSANIVFNLPSDLSLRMSAYKTLSRYPMQRMPAAYSYSYTSATGSDEGPATTPADAITDVTGANELTPLTALNGDIGLDWNPHDDMQLSVTGYWKKFASGTEETSLLRDIDIEIYNADNSYNRTETVVMPVDGLVSTNAVSILTGVEIGFQGYLGYGFGTTISTNLANTNYETQEPDYGDRVVQIDNADYGEPADVSDVALDGWIAPASLWGFSDQVTSASLYWENDKFNARVLYKYRSRYFQPNESIGRANRYVEDQEYWDFSAKYKLTSSVSLSLKVLNVMEETQYYTRAVQSAAAQSSSPGTKAYLGIKAKF